MRVQVVGRCGDELCAIHALHNASQSGHGGGAITAYRQRGDAGVLALGMVWVETGLTADAVVCGRRAFELALPHAQVCRGLALQQTGLSDANGA